MTRIGRILDQEEVTRVTSLGINGNNSKLLITFSNNGGIETIFLELLGSFSTNPVFPGFRKTSLQVLFSLTFIIIDVARETFVITHNRENFQVRDFSLEEFSDLDSIVDILFLVLFPNEVIGIITSPKNKIDFFSEVSLNKTDKRFNSSIR